ncbi:MAG TPA: SAVED domain-containing protein [Solirubrobacteraceae bacterium]|nr:SAVED domain-containing protein [Solirubrobacteraceae bacterium]
MRWGVYNEEVVLDAIEHDCSGFVLLLTDAVMDSRFILDIELPAMGRRTSSDPIFFAGAVFARNVGIYKSADELRAASGVELGSLLGSPLASEDLDADLRHVAHAVLRSYLRSALSDGGEPAVKLETRSIVPEADSTPIHLSWSPPLAADFDEVRSHVWDDELLPALNDLRAALEEVTQVRRLIVSGRPHLSAALALGFEFRAPTGWVLALRQDGLELDTARVEPDPGGWTLVRQPCSSGKDRRLVLCLHATKDVTRAMREHCRSLPPARVELHVRPSGGPGHLTVDGATANALVSAIAHEVVETRTRFDVGETHLYVACPWAMAAALGWHLSSVGVLVAHEADVERSSYRAACRLK